MYFFATLFSQLIVLGCSYQTGNVFHPQTMQELRNFGQSFFMGNPGSLHPFTHGIGEQPITHAQAFVEQPSQFNLVNRNRAPQLAHSIWQQPGSPGSEGPLPVLFAMPSQNGMTSQFFQHKPPSAQIELAMTNNQPQVPLTYASRNNFRNMGVYDLPTTFAGQKTPTIKSTSSIWQPNSDKFVISP